MSSWPEFFDTMQSDPERIASDPLLNGAQLFMTRGGCVQCHTVKGAIDANGFERAGSGILGPNLTHVGSRKSIGAGILDNRLPNDDTIDPDTQLENLFSWIYHSEKHKPGNKMYTQIQANIEIQKLTEPDFRDLATFVQSLK